MNIVDIGSGPAVVLIPGVQGRWEWMRPAVETLGRTCRVITFSLADEPTAAARFDERLGFESYVDQVREALDQRGLGAAAICGVSYGGLVAAAFATKYPQRASALILVSAPPPRWQPDRRVRFYLRAPRLLSPVFCVASLRMYPEIAAAHGGALAGILPALQHGWNAITHMFSPARMARRVTLLATAGLEMRLHRITTPTLVITGDGALDRVVPVRLTAEYANLCDQVEAKVIAHTGHLGLITRPESFAGLVSAFARTHAGRPSSDAAPESRRHVG